MSLQENEGGVGGQSDADMSMFRPPIVRTGTAAVNRALFTKKVDLAAAAVYDQKLISQYRNSLQAGRELLRVDRISPILPHPDQALGDLGRKCFLLNPSVRAEGAVVCPCVYSRGCILT